MSTNRVSTFKTFGKGRRTSKPLKEMTLAITKFAGPATNIKEYSVRSPAGFWSNVCKDLQVPNTFINRQKILQACLLKFKDVQDTKADSDVISSPVTNKLDSNCASMAKAIMKAFPKLPNMEFGTTPKEMAQEHTALALEILQASVFDAENNCSMCSKRNPPCPGPSIKWIQCDSCNRWFHDQCVQRDKPLLEDAQNAPWDCCFCKS